MAGIILRWVIIIIGILGVAQAQGELKGEVKGNDGQPAPFASIQLMRDGVQVKGTSADIDGKYFITGIDVGSYNIVYQSVGYGKKTINNVLIQNGKTTMMNDVILEIGKNLDPIVIDDRQKDDPPIFNKGDVVDGIVITKAQILVAPTGDPLRMITNMPGITSTNGEIGSVRGSRTPFTVFVDGVKLRGFNSIPGINRMGVEEVQLITGGVPVKYGDVTGGIIEVTTRSISPRYFGGIEGRTSQLLDKWGHYYFNGILGGPLIRKRLSAEDRKYDPKAKGRPVVGFLMTVEGGYDQDPNPLNGGSWKIKDEVLERLINEPLRLAPAGQSGTRMNAEYLRMSDFKHIDTRQNVSSKYLNIQGKLDFKFSRNTMLKAGGFVNLKQYYGSSDNATYDNILLNWGNNALTEEVNWNIYGKFVQRFDSDDTSHTRKSLLKNSEISLQADYVKGYLKRGDANLGNRFFDYGYVGKFTTYRKPTYAYGYDAKSDVSGWLFTGYQDTLVTFDPGTVNPLSSTITSQYYTFYNTTAGNYDNFANLQNKGAIINGQQPRNVYSLWNNIGTNYNNYTINDNSQFRVVFNGTTTIKDHLLLIGFEFEQRKDRAYSIQPVKLWTLARQYTNFHLGTIDTSNPSLVYHNGTYQDTVNYTALYQADPNRPGFGLGQTFFDWNLRQKLGYSASSLDHIDVDALDPSLLSLTMFSADELLNQGDNLVSYYGYDVYGNPIDNGSLEDFFLATDQYGNKTRPIAPFTPIYMAGYISDKFTFKDIVFSIGIRVDYFDANQKMLKDKYSLYQTRTAGDLTPNELGDQNLAANIQDNWVVYVDDKNNPQNVLGYRDGDVWYNAQGQQINDPSQLRTASGRAQPLLVDATSDVLTNPNSGLLNAFTDYKPQVNIMPRIAFSFPISDRTQFTAYYDVLTQRPGNAVRLNPLDYFFWDNSAYNRSGVFFNNPALRPEKTTDFSLGFRQALNDERTVVFKVNAFYREMRDYIALVKVVEAYPRSYGTWANIDFGTVKGLSFEFLISKRNYYLSSSYTLQFADYTGSSNTSALNLVNSGQPNLRTTIPSNYDRRHNFTAFFSWNFGNPKGANSDYLGPRSPKTGIMEAIFQNLGFSLTLRGGSGTPYSRQSNFTATQTGGGQSSLLGSINGARYPWQFNVDMQIYKNFHFKLGGKKGKSDPGKIQPATLQIYLMAENLFDIQNTINVYAATASATDDGYLTAPQYQPFINSQVDPQSFRDLYTMSVNDPRNYSLPRRMRIGAIFSF